MTTLMRRMGIEALYRRPPTSIPARDAKIYPYLLDGLAIERPNQVWSSDLTYLPMAHGRLFSLMGQVIRQVRRGAVFAQMAVVLCIIFGELGRRRSKTSGAARPRAFQGEAASLTRRTKKRILQAESPTSLRSVSPMRCLMTSVARGYVTRV